MLDRFIPDYSTNWDDCYDLLGAFGAFEDLNAYEYEHQQMTEDFFQMYNK